MTLLKAILDPTIIKKQEIFEEFPHTLCCFVNLDLLARYLLKTEKEDENALYQELEAIVAHCINGQFLDQSLHLEQNITMKEHVCCHPQIMKIPFSLTNPAPVLLYGDLGQIGWDKYTGYGYLNYKKTLDLLIDDPTKPSPPPPPPPELIF